MKLRISVSEYPILDINHVILWDLYEFLKLFNWLIAGSIKLYLYLSGIPGNSPPNGSYSLADITKCSQLLGIPNLLAIARDTFLDNSLFLASALR